MVFSSVLFVMFIIAVFLIYWGIPHKFRYPFILLANFVFYASFGTRSLSILICIILAAYLIGIALEKESKKSGVVLCFIALTLPLLIFKYLEFGLRILGKVLSKFSLSFSQSTLKLIVPVGISFFTFEAISYVADVYKGRIKAEKDLFKLATFISFFPTITSGPIERAGNFLPQLNTEKTFDYDNAVSGMRLMLLGFIKKIVMADYLALFVDSVFSRVYFFRGPVFIVAVILYTFEIYLDFSGYTDIARGAARILGFDISENFKAPYLSGSVKEFWARWHISLSSWLRDYIYIPLGGNRKGKLRKLVNLMVTFLVSGIWHGANFTFIVWGILHGFYQCIQEVMKDKTKGIKVPKVIKTIVTFVLVSFAWMFFRANALSDVVFILKNVANPDNFIGYMLAMGFLTTWSYVSVLLIIVATIVYDIVSEKKDILVVFGNLPMALRWVIYILAIAIVVLMKAHIGNSAEFIYFSF